MVKIKYIPNEDLELDKIPNPAEDSFEYFEAWERLAQTLNHLRPLKNYKEIKSKLDQNPTRFDPIGICVVNEPLFILL